MGPGSALAYALQLLTAVPQLIQAGTEVVAMVNKGRDKVAAFEAEKRDPTAAEWQELNDEISRLRGELHAP